MSCKEIIFYIVVPIISAIIGGGMTLWGVLKTLKYENKKRLEEIRIANKPLFYILHPFQDYNHKDAVEFNFYPQNNKKECNLYVFGILKNTEKALLIFDYIQIDDEKYYSEHGNVVDKNVIVNIIINSKEEIKSKRIFLVIKDILDNKYTYELKKSDNPEDYYIKSIDEIELS